MSYADTFEPEPEADELAQWVAWAFVAAFGLWAAWGWLADEVNALSLLLAVVFGLFQIATNILAVKVRELAGRGAWLTATAALGFMIATGLLTHESLNHAYSVTQAKGYATADPALMSWLLLVVPYLEPMLFWINRILVEPTHPKRAANVGVFTALTIWLFGAGSAAALPVQSNVVPMREHPPAAKRITKNEVRSTEPKRAEAKLLAQQGVKPGDIHKATGVPLSTCKRWAKAA